MKAKLAALVGIVAVFAASFAFAGTPKANAMLSGGDTGGPAVYCWWEYIGNNVWLKLCRY